ncbi:MAG: ABC transporter ATP-binding protein [Burkholderiales bacterium]|nr:MAG: ABC transporter ATP-binding protein [Burkholderiales bacterium]
MRDSRCPIRGPPVTDYRWRAGCAYNVGCQAVPPQEPTAAVSQDSAPAAPTGEGPSPAAARLQLLGITKRYPGVLANDAVDLCVASGEIHAVLGENGAGKSTLMRIIYGAERADAGEMRWEGRTVSIPTPAAARRLGIGMVFQHFSLFETLTVTENIALVLDERFDRAALAERIDETSHRYGLPVDPRRTVHALSVGERQRVEVLRCLLQQPRLLILDEPTSVLTPQAVERLFATLRRLAEEGVSIVYISHKLEEIRALCHSATVMRGGRVTGTVDPRRETAEGLARLMIGRELPVPDRRPHAPGPVRLAVEALDVPSDDPYGVALRAVSFELRGGEILGIAGISGNGQRELVEALSGEAPVARAEAVRIDGRPVGRFGAGRRRDLGLAVVPEQRIGRGVVPELSLADNAVLTGHRKGLVRAGLVDPGRARSLAADVIARFDVRTRGPDAPARSLSGGNLQKFIVGREIVQSPAVAIVAQPTWGVDVAASAAIRQQLIDLAVAGVAVLLISEELEELFEVCDRLVVLAQGRLSPVRAVSETDIEEIGLWMAGLFPGGPGQRVGAAP